MIDRQLQTTVEVRLRRRGAVLPEQACVWVPYGDTGFRLCVLALGPGKGKTVQIRSVFWNKPPGGSLRDQVNGIVGYFMKR